jgi:hypothetical protein
MATKRETSGKGKKANKKKGAMRNLKAKKEVSHEHAQGVKGSSFQWGIGRGIDIPS